MTIIPFLFIKSDPLNFPSYSLVTFAQAENMFQI